MLIILGIVLSMSEKLLSMMLLKNISLALISWLMAFIAIFPGKYKYTLKNIRPSQSLKIFTFRVKLSDSIFFLLGLSPIVKLI